MENKARRPSVVEGICFLLLLAALAVMQVLIGGTRMVFSLPSYALIGLAALVAIFSWRRVRPWPNGLCLLTTAVFLGYVLVRAILSPVPYIARSDIHSVLGGLAVYFLVACLLVGSRQRRWLVALLLALAMAHVVIGVVQFRNGTNFMPISWLQRYDYGRRASGFYICPNHLAGLLEVVGVMGLSIVCWSRWPVWGKLLVGYAVGVCYVGQILTGSRGGYLSVVASLAVFALLSFLILRRTGGRQAWALLSAGALVVVILGTAAAFYVSRSDFLKDRAQTTFDTRNMRVELWKSALQQWKLQPIIGTGSATYLYYGRLLRSPEVQLDPVYTHNDYLQLLAEYGLVAVAGLLAFLFAHARAGLRNFSRLGPKRVAASHLLPSNALALNVGALSALGSYLVHSIFDFNLHIPANVLLLAFVFGILANDGVMRERTAVSAKAIVRGWWFALPILGIALLVECARLLPGEYFSERARAAVRDYQPGLALRYANAGLKYDRTNPELFHWLGAANLQFADASPTEEAANSFREAGVRALENARSLFPQEQSYALRLAGAYDDLHQFDRAESVFADLHRLDPKSTNLQKYYEGHRKMWEKVLAPGVNPARPDADTGAANGKL